MARTENRKNKDVTILVDVRTASWLNFILGQRQWATKDLRMIIVLEDEFNDFIIHEGTPFDDPFKSVTLPEDRWRWIMEQSEKMGSEGKIPRWAIRAALFIKDEIPQLIKDSKGTEENMEDGEQ